MSRDGNGNYTRVPGSGYPNGTTADGPEVDAEMDDIATALTQSLSKDGQTVPTANLPMGGYRHTNVDDAAARTDYARADQVQDCALSTLSSVSGADTITATAPLSMTAYVAGQEFSFVSAGANTGAVTLNINSIGAKDVTKRGTTALDAGDIPSGAVVVVQYDGTRFQLTGPAPAPTALPAASETVAGVVELATNAEAQTGTDTTRAITPANLAAVTATETRAGVVELATSAEAIAGTDTARALTPATLKASQIVLATPVATTSGSEINLSTSVPSWARRLTVSFDGVSLSGSSSILVQIGDTDGFETSGYVSSSTGVTGTGGGVVSSTEGFAIRINSSSLSVSGHMTLTHTGSNTWIASHSAGDPSVNMCGGGTKTLTATLDRIRIKTVNGTDTFDTGEASVIWE